MIYLLDTNVCIRFLQGRTAQLLERFATHNTAEFTRVPDLRLDDWET